MHITVCDVGLLNLEDWNRPRALQAETQRKCLLEKNTNTNPCLGAEHSHADL